MTVDQTDLSINDIEPDGEIDAQTAKWFRSTLLDAITALDEADRDQRLRIKGRVFVLRDLFGLSEAEAVALAETYGQGDEMAELLEENDDADMGTFSTDDVRITSDGECVFVDTPVGTLQIGVYPDTPHDVDVTYVDHVNLGITGFAKERPMVEVDSREFPTDLTVRDTERAFTLSDRREESNDE